MVRKRKRREDEAGFGESMGLGEETVASTSQASQRSRLTPVDVQQKVFRLAFRGYNERDVDEFLDQITEDLAALHEENKRLREQLAEGGGAVAVGGAAAQQQAEAVVRQAREHAARLIEEAERRAAAMGASGGGALPPSLYLTREREFLQTLASLVQDHARTLKEEARRARSGSSYEGTAAVPAAAVSSPADPEPEPTAGTEPTTGETAATDEGPSEEPRSTERTPPTQSSEEGPQAPPGPRAMVIPEPETASLRTGPSPASTAEGPSEAASDRSGGGDPLLSAWDSAFSREDSSRNDPDDRRRRDAGDEPSLRELFWGEE